MIYSYCKACKAKEGACLLPDSHRAQNKVVWCADFLLGGKHGKRVRKQFPSGVTKKDVEKFEHLTIADFERGTFIPQDKSKTAFSVVADKYFNECIEGKTRHGNSAIKSYLKRAKELLGPLPLGGLNLTHLEEARRKFRETSNCSNAGINRFFSVIKTILNRAIEWGYISKNPAQFLRDLPVTEPIPRFLTVEEIAKLRACVKDKRLDDYVVTLLHTGIRPIDIKSLTWERVNLQNQVIQITTHKGRIPHTYSVPIDNELNQVLQRRYKETQGLGFVFDTSNLRKLADQAIKDSGINESRGTDQQFTIYGLKHCYASHLLMNGATLFDVAKLLGHTDMKMVVKHYGFLTQDHLRAVQAKINLTPPLQQRFQVI